MEYLELPDVATSYLHLLKDKDTLWDINNQPQMYEVEIVNENLNSSFDDIINMNKIYCSICNSDIPKIYLKQHNNSTIHQNLLKLTDKILERTRKHLKTNNELTNPYLNVKDTFFCDICSKIIQNNNKNDHFESKFHKRQAIFEKLLSYFLEAYTKVNDEDIESNWEDLNDIDGKNDANISQNISDPKISTDTAKEVPAINIFHADYLKELLESGRDESYSHSPGLQNSKNVLESKNLPNLQTSMESSKTDITTRLSPVPKDNKSECPDNQPFLKPMSPNLSPMNPNLSPINPNLNPINPNISPMNPNLNPMNPNLNPMNPNLNPMNPNLNPINPNFHHVNPINPNLNPMYSIWNPMYGNLNPNWNPMNPHFNAINPNLNPINPYFNPLNPHLTMNPNFNSINPYVNPMNTNNPNINTINPNLNPINPNSNTINPISNPINPNLHAIDPRNKLGPNSNIIKPNLNPINPNLNPINPNLNPTNSSLKLNPEFNLMEHEPKLGSNLNILDRNIIGPNPKTPDPAETKKQRRAERRRIQNIQAFEEFSSYIKTIQDKYPKSDFKIEAVTVSKIKVTALNGDCVLINRQNFQSINKKYCRVCQNGNLSADHEMSEEHVSKIMVPVADKNCIREIDDIWSHCIICNELIKFPEDHNKTAPHIANLKGCFIPKEKKELIDDKHFISDEEEKKIFSEEESRDVERVNTQEKIVSLKFDIHKFSYTLADKLLPLFAKYVLTKDGETESNDRTTESVKDNKNKVKQSEESTKNIVDKGFKAITVKKFDDEVASNSSTTSKPTTKYCDVCKIPVSNFEEHKTSQSHTEVSRIKEVKKIMNRNNLKEVKDSNDLLNCGICNLNINYNYKHINEHVYAENHRRNYFKYIGANRIILIDQFESQCEPCNKSISRIHIFEHCKQDKHMKKLNDFINIASSQQKETKSNENKTLVQNDIDVTKILYHFRAQDVEYLCKTCHVLVSRDAVSVKGHIESKLHVGKYNTLLRSNKISKTAGSFYCQVCDAEVPITGEITHIYGRNHIDNLNLMSVVGKIESNVAIAPSVIVSPNIPVASTSKEIPISAGKIEIALPLYIKCQYKNLSDSLPTCIICDQQVPSTKIENHAHSTTHSANFNMMMINNAIRIKDNLYFCGICNTPLPVFGEIEHIFGKLHLTNKKTEQPVVTKGTDTLTYDHVLSLTKGKRIVKL